ncbi:MULTISPECIES: hypothetical protein [Bacillus]|uniref:Uncharacterized protein n=1 Tax=Bacillus glycinifermentans TaxID=1664069 RepID=A0ABU6H9G9_9BACI|nr:MULTISPECIES: hypothetical protein [Bacillus]MDU0069641.1 hypothetical protein [Bacillus sp. IG6]MEC0487647.1 hypothetical protein [Bacillus glycinifermentans]MEC0495751.1 hypothetical protein [Bacillus glycinifermentans]MEC0542769.1 hypothetical protein [Bacillus glycinifermentans]MED8017380.1 hypothetical protein [Bacillus glycinifermentans]
MRKAGGGVCRAAHSRRLLAVYSYQSVVIFGFQACTLFLYWLAVYFRLPEAYPSKSKKEIFRQEKPVSVQGRYIQHRPVLLLMLLPIPVSLLYAQLETNYRLYLNDLFKDIYSGCFPSLPRPA